ncbi:hypothetical protein [Actinomadura barringtoniae]|nr:hypothetical protein [Actinomadura barringtoniae]
MGDLVLVGAWRGLKSVGNGTNCSIRAILFVVDVARWWCFAITK